MVLLQQWHHSLIPIWKLEACSDCCLKQRSAMVQPNSWLTRRCLLALLVTTALAVSLLFSRWSFLNPSAMFGTYCTGPNRQSNAAGRSHINISKEFWEHHCAAKESSECLTDKSPPTVAVSVGMQRAHARECAIVHGPNFLTQPDPTQYPTDPTEPDPSGPFRILLLYFVPTTLRLIDNQQFRRLKDTSVQHCFYLALFLINVLFLYWHWSAPLE